MTKRIAILGDFNRSYSTHQALNESVKQVKNVIEDDIRFEWVGTDVINLASVFDASYCGLWIAPGSPYKNMQNVLDLIFHARINDVPTIGNCGGFQHMILEYARNVCGIVDADHEETNPAGSELLISRLSCSLIEQEEEISIVDQESILFGAYKQQKILGRYFCSYGLNSRYVSVLKENGLRPTAQSADGQIRAFEVEGHPFFLGTLFQPALTSTAEDPNPLILEFVRRSITNKSDIARSSR